MNRVDACVVQLTESGEKVDEKITRAVKAQIDLAIEHAEANNLDVGSAVREHLNEVGEQLAEAKVVMNRNQALNFEARTSMRTYLDEHWSDDYAEGLSTLLTGVQINRPGAKDAASVLQAQTFDHLFGGAMSRLNVPVDGITPLSHVQPLGIFKKKNPNEDSVRTIMYHMDQTDPDPAMWSSNNPSMVEAAEILLEVQESMRKEANAVGSHYTPKLANHTTRRGYDGAKMEIIGAQTFIADMTRWMDMDKTKIKADDLEGVLQTHFSQEASGERMMNPGSNPESDAIPAGMGNVSKAFAERRVFHFKSPEAEIEFANKYGRGQLLESIAFNLELGSQRIGLMKKFGPNALANFNAVAADIGYKLAKEGDPTAQRKFGEKSKKIMANHWPMVDGSMFVPESHILAKSSQTYRAIKMWSQLGKAVLSAFADIPIYAAAVNYSGGSYVGGMFEAVGSLFKGTNPERMRLLSELGVISDNMRNTAMSRFDVDSMIPGGTSRITELFFKGNLLTPWTDRLRTGFAQARSHSFGQQRNKSFASLPTDTQSQLRQFNINEAEWDVLRAGSAKSMDGEQYITPEAVKDLDDSVISTYLKAIGKADNKSNQARYRAEVADRMRSLFHQAANVASLVPDAATRAVMLQGTRPGSIKGEAFRTVGMYKSFPIAIVRQVMGMEAYGRNADLVSAKGLMSGSAMSGMARMITMSTMFGAVAMSAKELVDGKQPSVMTSDDYLALVLRSMVQGGAMGLYGDFLLGEGKTRYGGNFVTT